VPPPDHVNLGPMTRTILDGAVLRNKDEFPAHQAWADEVERVLAFLATQGQFERLLRRLRAKERNAALAEARAGFYFHRNGFQIVRWEPEAVPGIPGDLEIAWHDTEPLFLEVKCPSWEGELAEEEIRARRTERPKYINAEGRAIDPVERVIYVVSKALPKFDAARINLVVVVDDLFVSPLDTPSDFVAGRLVREFADARYASVSGIFMLNPVVYELAVEYRAFFIPGPGKGLPDRVKAAFLDENSRSKTPPWFRE
jgi:hypothetical protein